MKSFVTGSRAYGTPRQDSDIDFVVLVTLPDLEALIAAAGSYNVNKGSETENWSAAPNASIRFGALNLIAFTDPVAFAAWHEANRAMKKHAAEHAPMTRDDAIAYLEKIKALRSLGTVSPPVPLIRRAPKFPDLDEED